MIIGDSFLDKDITFHTANHKYRGILKKTLPHAIYLIVGIDEMYIKTDSIEAFTVHGIEQRPAEIGNEE